MCRVQTFFCGCNLKSGAITAAVLSALSIFSYLIMGGVFLAHAGLVKDATKGYVRTNQDSKVVDDTITALKGLAGCCFLNAILLLVATISITIGIIKEHAGLVMVWLVIDMIEIVVAYIFAICCFVFHTWFQGIYIVALSGFSIYMWIVVLSYYHELNERVHRVTPNVKGYA